MANPERKTDIGPPKYEKFLPPIIKKNYGKWAYHEVPEPGVLMHVGESGDKLYSVRAASPRLLAITTIREFADLADKYCDGYLRFTSRNNVEFLLTDESKVEPLKKELTDLGYPVGGVGNCDLQHRPHPGLGPLPLVGHRRLRRRQVGDGRALPPLHQHGAAGQAPHRLRLLPQHVRRGPLLRHRDPRRPHPAADDRPRRAAQGLRDSRPWCPPAPPAPSGPRRSTTSPRSRSRTSSACTAATATPCAPR